VRWARLRLLRRGCGRWARRSLVRGEGEFRVAVRVCRGSAEFWCAGVESAVPGVEGAVDGAEAGAPGCGLRCRVGRLAVGKAKSGVRRGGVPRRGLRLSWVGQVSGALAVESAAPRVEGAVGGWVGGAETGAPGCGLPCRVGKLAVGKAKSLHREGRPPHRDSKSP